MNEQEFQKFIYGLFSRKDGEIQDYPQLKQVDIVAIGSMLLDENITIRTKETVILLLAHQQSRTAIKALERYIAKAVDPDLRIFAEIGLDECRWWNEP